MTTDRVGQTWLLDSRYFMVLCSYDNVVDYRTMTPVSTVQCMHNGYKCQILLKMIEHYHQTCPIAMVLIRVLDSFGLMPFCCRHWLIGLSRTIKIDRVIE